MGGGAGWVNEEEEEEEAEAALKVQIMDAKPEGAGEGARGKGGRLPNSFTCAKPSLSPHGDVD